MPHNRNIPAELPHALHDSLWIIFGGKPSHFDERDVFAERFRNQFRRLPGAHKRAVPDFSRSKVAARLKRCPKRQRLLVTLVTQRPYKVVGQINGMGVPDRKSFIGSYAFLAALRSSLKAKGFGNRNTWVARIQSGCPAWGLKLMMRRLGLFA